MAPFAPIVISEPIKPEVVPPATPKLRLSLPGLKKANPVTPVSTPLNSVGQSRFTLPYHPFPEEEQHSCSFLPSLLEMNRAGLIVPVGSTPHPHASPASLPAGKRAVAVRTDKRGEFWLCRVLEDQGAQLLIEWYESLRRHQYVLTGRRDLVPLASVIDHTVPLQQQPDSVFVLTAGQAADLAVLATHAYNSTTGRPPPLQHPSQCLESGSLQSTTLTLIFLCRSY